MSHGSGALVSKSHPTAVPHQPNVVENATVVRSCRKHLGSFRFHEQLPFLCIWLPGRNVFRDGHTLIGWLFEELSRWVRFVKINKHEYQECFTPIPKR